MKLLARPHARIALALLLALLLFSDTPTGAQSPPPITLTIEPAWEGLVRIPGWTELRVTVGTEEQSWEGELRLEERHEGTSYSLPLELPAPSQKQYRLGIFLNQRAQMDGTLRAEGRGVEEFRVPLRGIMVNSRVCAVVDPTGLLVPGISEGCDQTALLSAIAALPENPMAWETIDVLLLNGVDAGSLSPRQQQALLTWIGEGGRFIAAGTAGLPPLPADLERVSILPQALTRLEELQRFGLDKQPAPAATHPLLEQQRISLLPVGAQHLLRMSGKSLTFAWGGLLLLPIYLLLMGPGILLLVRRLRRPMLAWILWPLGILLGVGILSLWLSGALSQAFPLTHESALVFVSHPELPARVYQGVAVYAPRSPALRWEIEGAWPRTFYQPMHMYPGPFTEVYPTEVTWNAEGASLYQRRPRRPQIWIMEGITAPPQIETEFAIVSGGGTLTALHATLTSALPLRNTHLYLNDKQYLYLTDTIPSGVEFRITRPLTEVVDTERFWHSPCPMLGFAHQTPWGPTVLSSAPRVENTCYFVAETEGVPFSGRGPQGSREADSCLLIRVACPSTASGKMLLPLQIQIPNDSPGWRQEDRLIVHPPETVVELVIPDFVHADLTLEAMTLQVSALPWNTSSPPFPNLELRLWDWEAESWEAFPQSDFLAGLELSDVDLERFATANTLRLSFHFISDYSYTELYLQGTATVISE